ncbi:hypothetical protein AN2570.2 [Aspergillus nidulans FGSC A4]|uniref:DUF7703 domain-containing protein n=1 Tax=Emericella nidulans (strain FGSC A4 / ATCC 38163 / CBS 112.46 / NRRL 194 / M139) TaxID=227321 RepID=Q5BA60_EMENI|nr:hypothetical protein [Aspergillus nidulans FGSC A4]EAA64675.1 hypothetical protein AN2570.2 [Aspergillus nidulans FGSC A4]CBF87118.1 TPA: conserved hypothetical protein [Aspergillus nidulans FGSC A4]|eukprot:XP_660174.1 hypothetical protein AN2570.2 [Aspergillus nidulans FGSC A4]
MDLNTPPFGLEHGLESANIALRMTAAAFLCLALFNSLELVLLVCWTFHQRRGLYFWSLLISSIGIIPYVVGTILHNFDLVPLAVSLPIGHVGFICIVPVQSLILYSRLHLVFYHEKILRIMLFVIITVSIVLIVPNSVSMYGSAFTTSPSWNYSYNVTERLQVTGFAIQELLLSLFYVYSAVLLLRISPEGKSRVKRIMYELLWINTLTIVLDIAVVCLKVFVYSVKVKLELAVLGRLVALTNTTQEKRRNTVRRASFIGPTYDLSDFTNTNDAPIGTDTDRGPVAVGIEEVERPSTGSITEPTPGNADRRSANALAQRIHWDSHV